MDNRGEVREFLVSRRAQVAPERVGLRTGTNRRVPGLRRAEVAMLANVSVEYYSRLERGALTGASEPVLEAIADALQLDDGERAHLHDLARAAGTSPARPRRRTSRTPAVRPGLQSALDAVTAAPAFARNGRMDLLATNRLARALYAPAHEGGDGPVNLARFTFLDRERSERFYRGWSLAADTCVQILRTEAGRDPCDMGLTDLVGELSTRSAEFRTRWARHDVRLHASGVKQFHHPVVGDLDLIYEEMEPVADPGSRLLIYSAPAGSPSADALAVLASWAATHDQDQAQDERAARSAATRSPAG